MPDPALTEALLIALDYLKATGQAIGWIRSNSSPELSCPRG
jgi:hypothetical protein